MELLKGQETSVVHRKNNPEDGRKRGNQVNSQINVSPGQIYNILNKIHSSSHKDKEREEESSFRCAMLYYYNHTIKIALACTILVSQSDLPCRQVDKIFLKGSSENPTKHRHWAKIIGFNSSSCIVWKSLKLSCRGMEALLYTFNGKETY